jgi:YD repeat-containing protein
MGWRAANTTASDRTRLPTKVTTLYGRHGANLTQLVDAEDNQIDLDYNSLNSLTEITDGRRFATTYTYDENNPDPAFRTLLLSVEDPLNKVTGYTYTTSAVAPQPPGLLKTITDPNNNVTRFVYDEFGQRIETIDPLDHSTHYGYDALGRLETVDDPLGQVSSTCYDVAGRVVRSVANASGDGGTPQTDPCDAANYQPSSDPAFDRITTSIYEDSGNLIATIDPAGAITRTYYDANNRPLSSRTSLVRQSRTESAAYSSSTPDQNVRTRRSTTTTAARSPLSTTRDYTRTTTTVPTGRSRRGESGRPGHRGGHSSGLQRDLSASQRPHRNALRRRQQHHRHDRHAGDDHAHLL